MTPAQVQGLLGPTLSRTGHQSLGPDPSCLQCRAPSLLLPCPTAMLQLGPHGDWAFAESGRPWASHELFSERGRSHSATQSHYCVTLLRPDEATKVLSSSANTRTQPMTDPPYRQVAPLSSEGFLLDGAARWKWGTFIPLGSAPAPGSHLGQSTD